MRNTDVRFVQGQFARVELIRCNDPNVFSGAPYAGKTTW
jgi:hypothetical protein